MHIASVLLLVKVALLLVIAVQDFRYRAVYWFVFPLLAIAEILTQMNSIIPPDVYLLNMAMNGSLILIQITVLYIYFRFVRQIHGLFTHAFGLGDLLMLMCFACAFPFAGFIFFCLITFLVAILLVLFLKMMDKDLSASIPLAGIQAGIYIVLLIINALHALPVFSLKYWLFNFMN